MYWRYSPVLVATLQYRARTKRLSSVHGGAMHRSKATGAWCPREESFLLRLAILRPKEVPLREALHTEACARSASTRALRLLRPPMKNTDRTGQYFSWCPREESNLNPKLRKLVLYPLNYEGV